MNPLPKAMKAKNVRRMAMLIPSEKVLAPMFLLLDSGSFADLRQIPKFGSRTSCALAASPLLLQLLHQS